VALKKASARASHSLAEFDSDRSLELQPDIDFFATSIQYSGSATLKNWVTSRQRPNSLSAFPIDFWRGAKSAPAVKINNEMVPPGLRVGWSGGKKFPRLKSKIGYFASAAGHTSGGREILFENSFPRFNPKLITIWWRCVLVRQKKAHARADLRREIYEQCRRWK
jgi:hypothetical protein